jgi:REP element-mobilizing transposase RayT
MHSLPAMFLRDATDAELPCRMLAGRHHARFIDPDVPIHVISRVFQGRHLLRPSRQLNSIVVGVVGRALERYRAVRLYAMAFLSNHVHFMLQGPPQEVPAFIGFIKREISRRWGHRPEVGWHGAMWHEYLATALPTPASQVRCLKYVLSQGVKEGLVARPQDWPGVHCATPLLSGVPLQGTWLNATAYSRAVDAQSRKRSPRPVAKADHVRSYDVRFAPIPAWQHLDEQARRREVHRLIDEIISEGETARSGSRPLGARRIRRVPLAHRTELPQIPWLLRRRRMICWLSPREPEAIRFVHSYWMFQKGFRESAIADARHARAFPPGAYAPGKWTPPARVIPRAA